MKPIIQSARGVLSRVTLPIILGIIVLILYTLPLIVPIGRFILCCPFGRTPHFVSLARTVAGMTVIHNLRHRNRVTYGARSGKYCGWRDFYSQRRLFVSSQRTPDNFIVWKSEDDVSMSPRHDLSFSPLVSLAHRQNFSMLYALVRQIIGHYYFILILLTLSTDFSSRGLDVSCFEK